MVKDQNDAVIVGARVFLLNLQTRMEKVAVTNSGGVFTFEKVSPGNYEIRIAAEGFAQQITPVLITNAETDNLEITLAIGASNLTVTAEIGRSEQLKNVPQASERRYVGTARSVSAVTSTSTVAASTLCERQTGLIRIRQLRDFSVCRRAFYMIAIRTPNLRNTAARFA